MNRQRGRMRYIIMCGGTYNGWNIPRQLLPVCGQPVVARTIDILRAIGVDDIAISSNDTRFEQFGVPVLHHDNGFIGNAESGGCWAEAFYPTDDPACYLMGDVVFSPAAIQKIVDTDTDDIEFFASAPPFHPAYPKPYAEPFAFKVVDQGHFRRAISFVRANEDNGTFLRRPIAWELWQVIKNTPLNRILLNYTAINDFTCDIDAPEDAAMIEMAIRRWQHGGPDD